MTSKGNQIKINKVTPFITQTNQENDKKVIICPKFPQIPVGGHLGFFLKNLKKITDDQWVLSVIEGYKLEFLQKPPQTGIRQTSATTENLNILRAEVEDLLEKDAIKSQ